MYSLRNKEELEIYKCLTSSKNTTITIRGSSWHSDIYHYRKSRSAFRYDEHPGVYSYNYDLGFRCVKVII